MKKKMSNRDKTFWAVVIPVDITSLRKEDKARYEIFH